MPYRFDALIGAQCAAKETLVPTILRCSEHKPRTAAFPNLLDDRCLLMTTGLDVGDDSSSCIF